MPILLAALSALPSLFSAGKQIYSAVTGEPVADVATPEDLAAKVDALPEDQKADVTKRILDLQQELQQLDTQRFVALTDGDAEKVAATARPEIAQQAMMVLTLFAQGIRILFFATIAEWVLQLAFAFMDWKYPQISLWGLIAQAQPVTDMIWAPLIASFYACLQVILKYMGCRERDKAHEYEIAAGKPLNAVNATIEASGGAIASIVKAFKK